ncbi:transforming growth factor beta receptor type 3, partial [Biomphalaria pfeifferi]
MVRYCGRWSVQQWPNRYCGRWSVQQWPDSYCGRWSVQQWSDRYCGRWSVQQWPDIVVGGQYSNGQIDIVVGGQYSNGQIDIVVGGQYSNGQIDIVVGGQYSNGQIDIVVGGQYSNGQIDIVVGGQYSNGQIDIVVGGQYSNGQIDIVVGGQYSNGQIDIVVGGQYSNGQIDIVVGGQYSNGQIDIVVGGQYSNGQIDIVVGGQYSNGQIDIVVGGQCKNDQIDIVYDADVRTTGVRFNTFGSHSDIISATGGALVEWTQDHVAPVQLYAGIRGANSIKLLIPLQSNSKAPSPRDRTTDPNHNRSPLTGAQETKISDFQEGPVNLNDAINTTCLGGEMRVAISKKFIEVTGLDYSKISFKDPTCVPEDETDDFIILRTSFSECGTQSINFDNMTSFTNVVLIQTPPGLVSSLLEAELGSGYFEGETGSGSNDLAAVTDDEDFGRQPLNVTVECKVPAVIIHHVDVQPDSPKCRMTLYRDHFFLRSKTEYPTPIGKDTTIFIKSVTDSETMIQTESCWFSPSRQPYQPGVQSEYIIKHGCEQNSDTAFLDPVGVRSIMEETRLKVIVRDKFKGHHSVYLHCQFYTCQKNMPNCQVNRHQRCGQMDPSGPGSRPNCGPVTLGPLEITDKEISLKPPH